jgi:predicted transcriptional regulator
MSKYPKAMVLRMDVELARKLDQAAEKSGYSRESFARSILARELNTKIDIAAYHASYRRSRK